MGYSPWGFKELDMTEQLTHTHTHTHMHCKMVAAILTLNGYVCVCVVRKLKIYSLDKCQVYDTVLLIIVTMLYI